MRRDDVPSEAEIAAAVDRLLADADEGAPPMIDTWPPLVALDHPVNPPNRIA